jgi:hypothetical protein
VLTGPTAVDGPDDADDDVGNSFLTKGISISNTSVRDQENLERER